MPTYTPRVCLWAGIHLYKLNVSGQTTLDSVCGWTAQGDTTHAAQDNGQRGTMCVSSLQPTDNPPVIHTIPQTSTPPLGYRLMTGGIMVHWTHLINTIVALKTVLVHSYYTNCNCANVNREITLLRYIAMTTIPNEIETDEQLLHIHLYMYCSTITN